MSVCVIEWLLLHMWSKDSTMISSYQEVDGDDYMGSLLFFDSMEDLFVSTSMPKNHRHSNI
jgi:hypothetical protein